MTRILASLLVLASLVACSSPGLETYSERSPKFDPESFFSGYLTAHGVIKDWQGEVIRHFNADISACWNNGIGTLDEHFVFNDGERQQRVWTLVPDGSDGYRASAGDVVGEGSANWSGNAFFLNYVLRIPLDEGSINVAIDDRMYRVSENVVINESSMAKYGLGVGDILLTIVRHPEVNAECLNN